MTDGLSAMHLSAETNEARSSMVRLRHSRRFSTVWHFLPYTVGLAVAAATRRRPSGRMTIRDNMMGGDEAGETREREGVGE